MNNVTVNIDGVPEPLWNNSFVSFTCKVLDELNIDNWELSVLLCNDEIIAGLNNQYRNKNEPTDILSFTLGETITDGGKSIYLPGDIVISLETLKENAKYFQTPEDEELRRLIIHGILHLDGMDHLSNMTEANEPMLVLQEEILDKLKNERIMDNNGEKK